MLIGSAAVPNVNVVPPPLVPPPPPPPPLLLPPQATAASSASTATGASRVHVRRPDIASPNPLSEPPAEGVPAHPNARVDTGKGTVPALEGPDLATTACRDAR